MASELRCTLCRNVVDPEDLFCAACGREVEPDAAHPRPVPELEQGLLALDCRGCGASITYDAGIQATRCAFCGSTSLERAAHEVGRVRPTRRVPMRLDQAQALARFRTWLARGFWRPRRLVAEARVERVQAVYVPCWVFAGQTDTSWAADSSHTPAFAKADWCPVAGRTPGAVEEVIVLASGALSAAEVEGLAPFGLEHAVPYQREDLGGVPVEDVGLSRRGARPAARARIDELERARCAALVPGRARNVHVNVLVTDLTSEPVLLPVWINAYRWRERAYRFVVNGETGQVVGAAPLSKAKIALALAVGLLLVAGLLLLLRRR